MWRKGTCPDSRARRRARGLALPGRRAGCVRSPDAVKALPAGYYGVTAAPQACALSLGFRCACAGRRLATCALPPGAPGRGRGPRFRRRGAAEPGADLGVRSICCGSEGRSRGVSTAESLTWGPGPRRSWDQSSLCCPGKKREKTRAGPAKLPPVV